MTDKELRKLTRGELLDMLINLTEKNEVLNAELEETQKRLESRRIVFEKAGSLAEASLELNGVFEAAQEAAKQYLENVERLSAEADKEKSIILAEARKQADAIVEDAEKYSTDIRKKADEYWNSVYDKAQVILEEHGDLEKLAHSIERK